MKPIYTIDIETDPFRYKKVPEPFAIGIYGEGFYHGFWGSDCVERAFEFLDTLAPGIVFAHNGGKFDFYYFMDYLLNSKMMIKGSRIITAEYEYMYGKHEFRDSYAIMPFALKKYKGGEGAEKLDIKIWKLKKRWREKYKEEIREYLRMDCVVLHKLCTRFIETFGASNCTIGTASMKEFLKLYEIGKLSPEDDKIIRGYRSGKGSYKPGYYYGGRVECFDRGIIKGDFKIYDVNSMYPYVMKNFKHPTGNPILVGDEISDATWFMTVEGRNYGAFPRVVNGVTRFDTESGIYHVTKHEYDTAIELGLFELERVHVAVDFDGAESSFEKFVDKFYDLRLVAKAELDEMMSIFWKGILVNCYGKFGQNPDNYTDQKLTDKKTDLSSDGYRICEKSHHGKYVLWEKPSANTNRYNVATGASITGAARSVLMRGIANAKRPIYCDTDSLICEHLDMAIDGKELGSWKLEGEFNVAAIGGRKLYAMFETRKKKLKDIDNKLLEEDGSYCVKQANKGVSLTPTDIWNICCGDVIQTYRDAPSYKLDGSYDFIKRKVRMTA